MSPENPKAASYTAPLRPLDEYVWPRSSSHKKSTKLLVYLLALFVALAAALLVLATVVRPRKPGFEMSEVQVKNLTYSNGSGPMTGATLNATLAAAIKFTNPNFGQFDRDNATVRVVYGGALEMGEKRIGPGRVRARGTQEVEVVIDVRLLAGDRAAAMQKDDESGGLIGNFTREVGSGSLKLRSYGRMAGKVDIMGSKVMRRRMAVEINCEFTLNLTFRSVQDLVCW